MQTGSAIQDDRQRRRAERRRKGRKKQGKDLQRRGRKHKVPVVEPSAREQQLGRLYREAL